MNTNLRTQVVLLMSEARLQPTANDGVFLNGRVYGKAGFEDGGFLSTTRITAITEDDTIITRSGSHYRLAVGETDVEFEHRTRIIKALHRKFNKR